MINTLKRLISVLIIISSVIQLGGYNVAFAAGEEYKDPYKTIYLSEFDGEDYYLPANFTYRDGFGSETQGGHYVSWKNVNFDEAPVSVELTYGTMHNNTVSEIRIDSVIGPVVATFTTPAKTGSMFTKGTVEVDIQQEITGVHDLYFVWKNSYLNIQSFIFRKNGKDNLGYSIFEGMSNDIVYDDLSTNALSYEIKLLNKLGMLGFIQDSKFDSRKTVTNAEFIQALCGFYTDEVTDSGEAYFYDLPALHTKSKYVNYMYHQGIVEMTQDKHFRPDTIITVEQALKIIKNIYNLDEYENDIIAQTEKNLETTILSGVSGKMSDNLTRQNLAVMLSNAIEATYITYKISDGGDFGLYYTDGILKETRNLDKTYGLVNAVPSTSLSNVESGLTNGEVLIGDTVYNDYKNLAQKYLGYNCVVFYEEINGELNVEAIYPRSNVSETVIDTTENYELENISENLIEYSDSEGKINKTKLAKNVYFIYNGKAIDETIDKFVDVETFSGKIRIVDNKDCTAVLIDEYQNALLKSIDSVNSKYLDRITDTLFDFSDDDVTVYKDSHPIMDSDIPADSAVYIYRSKNTIGKKITRIVVLPEKKVTGGVTSINEDGITVESEQYKIAKENTNEYRIGFYGTFVLNTYNEIIWSDSGISGELSLGIFLGHTIAEDEETVTVKLFTNDGAIQKYECTKRFILDGVARKEVYEISNGKDTFMGLADVEIRTPVMYMLNEEKQLVVLDTYFEGRKTKYDNLVKVGTQQKFRFSNKSRILTGYDTGYGAVPFDANSTLISLWAGTDDTCDAIEVFRNQIVSNEFPIGQAYSTKGNERIADVFVWIDRAKADADAKAVDFVLVDKVIDTINEDDMPTKAIVGYSGIEKVTKYISEQPSVDVAKINRILATIKRGDYIYTKLDPKGKIIDIEVNYFCDGVSMRNGVSSVLYNSNSGHYREAYDQRLNGLRAFCKIIDIEDNYMFVRTGSGANAVEEVYALQNPSILKVYSNGIEAGLATKEIFNSITYGTEAVVMVSEGCANHIIIYE